MKKNYLLLAVTVIVLVAPLVVLAQASGIIPPNPAVGTLPGNQGYTIAQFIEDVIVGLLLPLAGLVAVLFIIIGGFQYMTSAGNEELAERGKKTLQNGIIGLIIIILSYVIVTVIANAF
jgi:hypothetical protein